MKSLKLIAKRSALFLLKLLLVAIPAVVASYFSYRAAIQTNIQQQQAYVEMVGQVTNLLERQAMMLERHEHVILQMRGQIDVLRMLAAARTGAGVSPIPAEYDEERDGPRVSLKTARIPTRSLP